ncbi:hypothetical protein ACROYT_G032725 [Oculina patagonica]
MATNNFLDLTALAAYGGRQVVVPLVNDSKFHGSPTEKGSETLALYYNVTALNRTLRSRGHGTLISWKEFQEVCQGKLDVLVHFDYAKLKKTTRKSQATRPFFPCNANQWNISTDFEVKRTVCMNVFAVHSVEKFENEVVKRLPCVGFDKWRGSKYKNRLRAQFQLSPFVTRRMRSHDAAVFFNSNLLHVAQDFIAKKLGPYFIAVHIRTERILSSFKNIARVKKCISNLSTLVQRHKNVSTAHIPVFLAADFADFGSSSRQVKPARENAKSLMKILAPLKPVIFQPSAYNLTDRGAVAIVEMNILVSAKHLFVVGGVVSLFYYAQKTKIENSSDTEIDESSHPRNNATDPFNRFPYKESVDNLNRTGKKIFIAFSYWEQLTAATNSFLGLTALAAYGERQVVVPFVKHSLFYASPATKGFETLALYYNVTALNRTLRSRGHGTLISWKEFQDVCQGKLDVLVFFDYTNNSQARREDFSCKGRHRSIIGNFNIERTICMNVFAVDSVEKFENEVVKRLPCVGLAEWRGSNNKYRYRAQFNLSSVVTHRMHSGDAAIFFSSKLLHVARDFIAKNLGLQFFSMHIRTERILKLAKTIRDIAAVKRCISNLTARVQSEENASTPHIPVFLAADFADYGSSSRHVNPARKNAKSLMKILAPLKPVNFQPSAYNLTDRGAVAIVEMNILVSAKHLFVVGGGTFQNWIVNQFLNKNKINGKSRTKCQNELCNSLCCY